MYRVRIHGDPPLECQLMGQKDADGRNPFYGLPWTGLVGCTVVPQVCDAAPGVVSHLDLGLCNPRGWCGGVNQAGLAPKLSCRRAIPAAHSAFRAWRHPCRPKG